jgi:hypothetical protein
MPSKWRGIGRVRGLLRRMPDAVRGQITGVMERAGPRIQAIMRARAPVRRGKLREGIVYRVYPKSLRLRLGLLGTPRGRAKLFYGRIQDLGRAAQTVNVVRNVARKIRGNGQTSPRRIIYSTGGERLRRRGPNKGTPIGSPYKMRVRAMPGKFFVTGRMPNAREELRQELNDVFDNALRTAAEGGTDA